MRKAGILMGVASIPSKYGIGDFGPLSYKFIDKIAASGFKIWQILPLNPLGFGNSPYQPYSSMAMDELYISLDMLINDGYLDKASCYKPDEISIDYCGTRQHKEKYLKKAYANFEPTPEYIKFIEQRWVYEYAVFITLKKHNDMKCWNEWPENQKDWIKTHECDLKILEDEIHYEQFIQYILLDQWQKLRLYANKNGIEIMGDIPIYVGIDSLDVWSYQKGFLLDEEGYPTFIAGVPPDYFSAEGQRWGNPLYDWNQLENDKFEFWLNRLNYCSKLFDIIRIDHFRAFDTYWKIKSSCVTAIEGEWIEAPGYALFDRLFSVYPDIKLVVEDLGYLRDEVLQLRDHYQLTGMRVVQYSFDTENEMMDKENLLVYTGTHDNEPLACWFDNMCVEEREEIRKYFKLHNFESDLIDNLIQYTLDTHARYAIISIVDLLRKNETSRINCPGTIGEPNWCYKMKNFEEFEEVQEKIKKMIKVSKR